MMQIVYKIDSVNNVNGGKKKVSVERRMKRFQIARLMEGASAILVNVDKPDETLMTSKVEKVFFSGNHITVTTQNSVYYLEAKVEGV